MSDKFRFNGVGLEIGIPLSDADSSAISQWAENAADLARKHEQERIIKLLEDPATMSNWWAMPDKSLGLYGNLKNYVIELIKGETNE